MKYSKANLGRIFILRLENGDIIPDTIEKFAEEQKVKSAVVYFLGASDIDSKVVVGPEDGTAAEPHIMVEKLLGTSESVGIGTLFLDEEGRESLHLHSGFGHGRETVTGCTRKGVKIWHIGEIIIFELLGTNARRKIDPETGFELLEVE